MSISSSLNAGVAGLNANATRLATIADNIANSGTYGYRRVEADFSAMVLQGGGTGSYSAGGVRVATQRLIDDRGPLVSTSNATDLAVDGRGMLPVTTAVAAESGEGALPLSLVTTGSFRADENGFSRRRAVSSCWAGRRTPMARSRTSRASVPLVWSRSTSTATSSRRTQHPRCR